MPKIKPFVSLLVINFILLLSINAQASDLYKVNMKANTLYVLGMKFLKGVEVKQNLNEARTWLTKAAQQGHLDAKNQLSKLPQESEDF